MRKYKLFDLKPCHECPLSSCVEGQKDVKCPYDILVEDQKEKKNE